MRDADRAERAMDACAKGPSLKEDGRPKPVPVSSYLLKADEGRLRPCQISVMMSFASKWARLDVGVVASGGILYGVGCVGVVGDRWGKSAGLRECRTA